MDQITQLFSYFFQNPVEMAAQIGLIGLFLIVFAETGLLVGFFLPGDSLLFGAGMYAATGNIDIHQMCFVLFVAAVSGDAVGYAIGKKLGSKLYTKEDSFLFPKKHIQAAQDFYNQHGGKTIILSRFIPIIRTFAPTIAGAAQMPYLRFALFNFVGAILWVYGLCLSAYYLGKAIPELNKHLHYILIGIILVSVLPIAIKILSKKAPRPSQDSQ